MAATLAIGQKLIGRVDSYTLVDKIRTCIWRAKPCNNASTQVLLKFSPISRLQREREALQLFRGHHAIRQMLDEVQEPPCLVLEHLDGDLLSASGAKQLERHEIKAVAKSVLEALAAFHSKGWVHTDVKPDNILFNRSRDGTKLCQYKLADCGDSLHVAPGEENRFRIIGATIFRSPEAMLNLNWGSATDIWSFGTTLISLLWGENWHIFKPPGIAATDETYALEVLRRQDLFFGPFPTSYVDFADGETLQMLTVVTEIAEERRPFSMTTEIHSDDRDFLCKVMKLDPRDRPSAAGLLADAWFAREGQHENQSI